MFLKRTLKILSNLILLVVLCTGQAVAAPNARPAEDGSQEARLDPIPTFGSTMRVSVSSEGVEGDDDSTNHPSISADGRYVAFTSEANNLVDGDTNGVEDVFVHDYLTNTTTRVSVNSSGEEGNYESPYYTSLSADGRYVAFQSHANNLVDGDMNYKQDIFVRDTLANTTIRVSVNSSGEEGNERSDDPSISADGRYVAFESAASNLVDGDTNDRKDIFVRDTLTNTTIRVSVNSSIGEVNGGGMFSSISADGRYVAFESYATDLVDGDTNGVEDVFVHDTLTNTTTRVSVNSSGVEGNSASHRPSISADGRYVAFASSASNFFDGDNINSLDIFVHDTLMNTTTYVSLNSDGVAGNLSSSMPSISADGRYVAFRSSATNLVDDDTNGIIHDIFVRDILTNTTIRVSVNSSGVEGNDDSMSPSISADGQYVAFSSRATNFVDDDTNNVNDIFVHAHSSTRVIVFVPGWLGGSVPPVDCQSDHAKYEQPMSEEEVRQYFQGVGDQLMADGANMEVFYAQLVSNACYTPPIEGNVDHLLQTIDQAKAQTDYYRKVTLIAHGMGGLAARAYIEGSDYRGDVETLFTFGSPHLGAPPSALAYLLAGPNFGSLCADGQPALCDFSTTGMAAFDWMHHKNNAVTYHTISGDAPFESRNPLGMATGVLIPGPDDGLVSTDSGGAAGLGTFDRLTTDEVQGPGAGSFGPRTYFVRDGGISTSYTDCIKSVLVDGASNCGTVGAATPVQEEVTAPMAQRTPFESGTLLAGESVTRDLVIEGGATLFAARWQAGTLVFTLVDPGGQTIDEVYADANPGIVTYTEDAGAAVYYFPSAAAGTWQVKLQAVSAPAEGAPYSAFAAFDSAVTLTVDADQSWYASGDSAALTVTLGGSPSSATVTANVIRADGVSDPLTFSSMGEGQYQAAYPVPDMPGYAEVQFAVSGAKADSQPFERGANLTFQISPDTFALNGAYDDILVLYQFLDVAVGIDAAADGRVGLSGDLVDESGNFVAHALTLQDVTAGASTLTLRFKGTDIFASHHDGPYTLTNLLLTDENGAAQVTQQAEAAYTTALYLYTQFTSQVVFDDVPSDHWARRFIERLYYSGVTGGCRTDPLWYCPNGRVTREQMAVFLLVAEHGTGYVPADATGTVFDDVPASDGFAKWIEQLAAEGITGGCGGGNYCPNAPVTREQMAVFLLVAEHGTGYTPPTATGVFADVPASNSFAPWIEQLAAEGITGGCGGGNFCPKAVVNRAQMAVFLVTTFDLP